ncbi:hypothetical protein PRIPAC_80387 [Pristionchus pacificus]|nr:hypothetical protein PRIPAC_80387 [Pristionchus pacificus]
MKIQWRIKMESSSLIYIYIGLVSARLPYLPMHLSLAGSSGSVSRRIPKIIVSKFGSLSSRSSSFAHSPTPASSPRSSTLSLNDLNSEKYLKVPRSPSFDVGVGLPSRRVSIDMGDAVGKRMMDSRNPGRSRLERSCSLNILPSLPEEPQDSAGTDAPNDCCFCQIVHSLLRSCICGAFIIALLIPIVMFFFYTLLFIPFTNTFNSMGQKANIEASIHNLFIHSIVNHLTVEETTVLDDYRSTTGSFQNSTLPTELDYLQFASLVGL